MNVDIIEYDVGQKKDGSPYWQMTVMGKFNSFGKVKTSTVEVNLTFEQYELLKDKEGLTVDLDFIIPKPSFPLTLSENNKFTEEAKHKQK